MQFSDKILLFFALAIGAGFVIAITAILTDHITRYKLKVEQIRADAMVRAEEVRTRNQMELERLMDRDRTGGTNSASNICAVDRYDENKSTGSRVREG